MKNKILKEEDEILTKSVEIWNLFMKLESQHPDDNREMRDAVNKIQAIIGQRLIQRIMPDKFPIHTNKN